MQQLFTKLSNIQPLCDTKKFKQAEEVIKTYADHSEGEGYINKLAMMRLLSFDSLSESELAMAINQLE